jgi:pilus assembly protein CpaB
LLRRTKTIVFDDEPDTQNDNEPSVLRKAARRGLDIGRTSLRKGPTLTPRETEILPQRESIPDDEPSANPVHERVNFLRSEFENEPISRGSQESLAALRAEFRRKHVENGDDTSSGPSLPSVSFGFLKPSRIILLAVALIAGGVAAWLAVGREPDPIPEPAVVQQVAPAIPPPAALTVEVLVAKASIPVGTRLTPELLEWQKWPEETVRTEYVTSAATPEAMTDLSGSVARLEILAGEPVRREKLGQAGAGYLSAILEPGKRAVSVSIDAKSASGGFIMPNDHVDVVLTSQTPSNERISRTILTNVRVLAVNSKLGASEEEAATASPEESVFADQALATLELDPAQAELIINATTSGELSLVLRPTADVNETVNAAQQAINQSIRMTSPFWVPAAGSN